MLPASALRRWIRQLFARWAGSASLAPLPPIRYSSVFTASTTHLRRDLACSAGRSGLGIIKYVRAICAIYGPGWPGTGAWAWACFRAPPLAASACFHIPGILLPAAEPSVRAGQPAGPGMLRLRRFPLPLLSQHRSTPSFYATILLRAPPLVPGLRRIHVAIARRPPPLRLRADIAVRVRCVPRPRHIAALLRSHNRGRFRARQAIAAIPTCQGSTSIAAPGPLSGSSPPQARARVIRRLPLQPLSASSASRFRHCHHSARRGSPVGPLSPPRQLRASSCVASGGGAFVGVPLSPFRCHHLLHTTFGRPACFSYLYPLFLFTCSAPSRLPRPR